VFFVKRKKEGGLKKKPGYGIFNMTGLTGGM
jgi:hypothetical protein